MSNNSNSDDQTAALVVSGVLIVLAIVSVILRFHFRVSTQVGLGWDDAFILASIVISIVTAAIVLWGMIMKIFKFTVDLVCPQ